jgi:hypothetical protein
VFFRRSAIEGATDADLIPGRSVRIAIEPDAGRGPRVSRLVLNGGGPLRGWSADENPHPLHCEDHVFIMCREMLWSSIGISTSFMPA